MLDLRSQLVRSLCLHCHLGKRMDIEVFHCAKNKSIEEFHPFINLIPSSENSAYSLEENLAIHRKSHIHVFGKTVALES